MLERPPHDHLGTGTQDAGREDRAAAAVVMARAEAAWRAGRLEDAIAILRGSLERAPDRPAVHQRLGNALKAAGRPAEAMEAYRRAAVLAPADADLLRQWGNILRERNEPAAAIRLYRRALACRPDGTAMLQLGHARRASGDDASGVDAYRRALADIPLLGSAWLALANTFCRGGALRDAWTAYRRASASSAVAAPVESHNFAVLESLFSTSGLGPTPRRRRE